MRRKPVKIPDERTTETVVERYVLRIPEAYFTMWLPGPESFNPEYDPVRLVDAVVDGLQRGGYHVEVTEEHSKTVKKVFNA
jgi:hypothetical protein